MDYQNLPKLDEFMKNIKQHGELVKHKYTHIKNYNNFAMGLFDKYKDVIYISYTFRDAISKGISANKTLRDLITQMRQNDFGTRIDYYYHYTPTSIRGVRSNLHRLLIYYLGKVYRETANTNLAYLVLMLEECSEQSSLVLFYDMFEVIQESSRLLDKDIEIGVFRDKVFEKQLSEQLLSIYMGILSVKLLHYTNYSTKEGYGFDTQNFVKTLIPNSHLLTWEYAKELLKIFIGLGINQASFTDVLFSENRHLLRIICRKTDLTQKVNDSIIIENYIPNNRLEKLSDTKLKILSKVTKGFTNVDDSDELSSFISLYLRGVSPLTLKKLANKINYKGIPSINDILNADNRGLIADDVEAILDKQAKSVSKYKPKNLERLTYAGVIEKYFKIKGYKFKFKPGLNKPKLSKQLSKQNIPYTQKELQAFTELRIWFLSIALTDVTIAYKYPTYYEDYFHNIYIDWNNNDIPDNVDEFAFTNSCNKSISSVGNATHLVLRDLGWEYLKFYTELYDKNNNLKGFKPVARAYFYAEHNDFAHAGMYSDIDHFYDKNRNSYTNYLVTSLFLCIKFNRLLDDVKDIQGHAIRDGGFELPNDVYFEYDDIVGGLNFWSNAYCGNDYSTLGTNYDLIKRQKIHRLEEGIAREYFEILEKNISLRKTLRLSETILIKENKNETKYNATYTIDTSNQDTGRAF